jgi:hypothetical protein
MADSPDDAAPAKRGHAAWKEAQDAISQRNADAHKRAREERGDRDGARADRNRREAEEEAKQLRDLNKQIAKRGAGGQR